MNVFKSLYCNQYAELAPQGKGAAARANGTGLLTVALLANIAVPIVLVLLLSEDVADAAQDIIEDMFGRRNGRGAGRFIGFAAIVPLYFGVKFTIGTESSFNATIKEYNNLPEDEQKAVSKKGLRYFLYSLGLIVPFILYAVIMAFGSL